MKYLTALSLLQTALLVFLLLKVTGDEAPAPAAAPTATPATGSATWTATPLAGTPTLDEARLRQIIREELAAGGGTESPRDRFAAASMDPEQAARLKAQVAQRINHFRSVGRASEQEMGELQVEIARLDPAGRKEMLAMLARAINAQEIKAQL